MSLITLVSSLLRPTTVSQRAVRGQPRIRLNLETLEDRRLLSGCHGSGLDDSAPVEIEHPVTSSDTPSVTRGLDDNSVSVSGVSDTHGRGNEGETGGGRRHGQGNGKPANTPKNHPKRHGAGEHVIKVLHA
jgi:hypothetical protein